MGLCGVGADREGVYCTCKSFFVCVCVLSNELAFCYGSWVRSHNKHSFSTKVGPYLTKDREP